MLKKVLIALAGFMIIVFAVATFVRHAIGGDAESIFKNGGCLRDDGMGVTYRIQGTAKGSVGAEVIASDKYTSEAYKVGAHTRLPLDRNPQKLYPIKCQ